MRFGIVPTVFRWKSLADWPTEREPENGRHSHKVQINKFLLLKIIGGNILQDIREKGRNVFPERHGHDGLLNRFLPANSVSRRCLQAQTK